MYKTNNKHVHYIKQILDYVEQIRKKIGNNVEIVGPLNEKEKFYTLMITLYDNTNIRDKNDDIIDINNLMKDKFKAAPVVNLYKHK